MFAGCFYQWLGPRFLLGYIFTGSLVAINLLFFELSLKMLKMNNRISFEKSDESQSIKELIFSKSHNLKELEIVFEDLVRQWPQHKSGIKSLVEERRKLLQCQERIMAFSLIFINWIIHLC